MERERNGPRRGLTWYGGVVCALAGFALLLSLIVLAASELDEVAPVGDTGNRMMVRAITGTMLMILGTVLLHIAHREAEGDDEEEREPR